jgi:hypothetical protein
LAQAGWRKPSALRIEQGQGGADADAGAGKHFDVRTADEGGGGCQYG